MPRKTRHPPRRGPRTSYVLEIVGTGERVPIPASAKSHEDALAVDPVYAAMRASAEREAAAGTAIDFDTLKRQLDEEFGPLPEPGALVIHLPAATHRTIIKRASAAHLDPAALVLDYIKRGLAAGE